MDRKTQTFVLALFGILVALVVTTDAAAGCTPDPCKNNGTCTEDKKGAEVVGYKCTCVPGYKDKTCSTVVEPCKPNPCKRGAKCAVKGKMEKDFKCDCGMWWTAQDCSRHDVSLTILVATCLVVLITILFVIFSFACNARRKKKRAQQEDES